MPSTRPPSIVTRPLAWSLAAALLLTAQTGFAYLSPDEVFGPVEGEETEMQETDASSFEETTSTPVSDMPEEGAHSSTAGKVFYRNGETVEVKPVQREIIEHSSSSSSERMHPATEDTAGTEEPADDIVKAIPLEETAEAEAVSTPSVILIGTLLLLILMVMAGAALFVIKFIRRKSGPGQDLPLPPPVVLPSSRLHQSLHPTEMDSSAS